MNWFRRFMLGRYGTDQLSMAMLVLFVVFAICSRIINSPVWSGVFFGAEVVLIFVMYFRIFSRNITKRAQENESFLKLWRPFERWFRIRINRFKSRKEYRYFKCPGCKKDLKVPRGKGEITITCPVCKTKLTKRT